MYLPAIYLRVGKVYEGNLASKKAIGANKTGIAFLLFIKIKQTDV